MSARGWSYIAYGSFRAVIPHQAWSRSCGSHRRNVDDRASTLLFQQSRYDGGCTEEYTFDIDVEAFVKVRLRDLQGRLKGVSAALDVHPTVDGFPCCGRLFPHCSPSSQYRRMRRV